MLFSIFKSNGDRSRLVLVKNALRIRWCYASGLLFHEPRQLFIFKPLRGCECLFVQTPVPSMRGTSSCIPFVTGLYRDDRGSTPTISPTPPVSLAAIQIKTPSGLWCCSGISIASLPDGVGVHIIEGSRRGIRGIVGIVV